jgi:hypothetical protein
LKLIIDYFGVSRPKAKQYVQLLSSNDILSIKEAISLGGTT